MPPDFVWPTYEGESYDHVVKNRPLTFLAQFNCEELAQFDKEHLLPDHGLLSFFYEMDTQCWGYDPKDKGCARVYWFEDLSALSAANFPADMEEDFKFPMVKIKVDSKYSYPSWQDFSEVFPDEKDEDAFNDAWEELTGEDPEDPNDRSQLLGWPDVIQNSMFDECDLVTQGYYLGNGWVKIPKEVRQQAEETARDRWMLLFQLDTVELGDFELMFGDCGHIYFYLSAANFPADMEEDFKFPMVKIKVDSKYSYPSWQDFSEVFPDEKDEDAFNDAWEELTGEDPEDPNDRSQLLGWPDVIQNSMFDECDLVTQGYYLGNGWVKIPKEVRQQAEETARDRWMLLFQLDTVELGDFELMFGDCGHIYFYITKEDLAARRFDRIWLILQCY